MSNYVRRLVSGNKARFKDLELGLELDLIYLTDHVIIMGFPASGVEGFYRNPREEVKRFLDTRHGKSYRVFNFCPTRENSYPASTFAGKVSKYPFPDHHAPPIALLALATKEMMAWLKQSSDHVVVLHCKAGKGRSGTLACSLLLALDEAISPPKLQRSYNASEWADARANEIMQEVSETDGPVAASIGDESDIPSSTENANKPAAANATHAATLTVPVDDHHGGTSSPVHSTVEKVLLLHTSRRMKKDGKSQGVSISSQRRWLRYWAEILYSVAPRQLQLSPKSTGHPPKARLYGISIRMKESGGGAKLAVVRVANLLLDRATRKADPSEDDRGASNVWVSLARYDDDMVQEMERRVRANEDVEYESDGITVKDPMFATSKWDDGKMVRSFARLGVAQGDQPKVDNSADGSVVTYNLVPIPSSEWIDVGGETESSAVEMNDGIVLDSSRELRVKLYTGQVFMGWMWFIPCFHLPQPPSRNPERTAFKLTRKELDFPLGFGALLIDVELTIGWDLDTVEEEAPREPESPTTSNLGEPSTTGVVAAVAGVEAMQAARD